MKTVDREQTERAVQPTPQLLKFITKVAMTSHTPRRPYGVTGTATTQHVVFGMTAFGMKNGASGTMISAGSLTELGKCLE